MTAPVSVLLAFLGLFVSAQTKMHAVILGQPVTVPVLWLIVAAFVLGLLAVVLWLVREIARERGIHLRFGTVTA